MFFLTPHQPYARLKCQGARAAPLASEKVLWYSREYAKTLFS